MDEGHCNSKTSHLHESRINPVFRERPTLKLTDVDLWPPTTAGGNLAASQGRPSVWADTVEMTTRGCSESLFYLGCKAAAHVGDVTSSFHAAKT